MSGQELPAAIMRLEEILSVERDLLLAGQPREVAGLIEEKMSALQGFQDAFEDGRMAGAGPALREAATRVMQMAEENAAHLDAVRNGVRALIRRIEAVDTGAYVGSYNPGGGRIAFPQAVGQYQKRV